MTPDTNIQGAFSPVLDKHPTYPLAVYLILIDPAGKVLLSQRHKTGFADGWFSLPAGHVERKETPVEAILREAQEELDLSISSSHLTFHGVVVRQSYDTTYMDLFYRVHEYSYDMVVSNREPEKCSQLLWADIADLPANTLPYVADALSMLGGPPYLRCWKDDCIY